MIVALPGLSWIRENSEKLIVYLPHGELEITGGDLSRAIQALLDQVISQPCGQSELVSRANEASGVSLALCQYAFRMLEDARCIRTITNLEASSNLDWLFWLRTGEGKSLSSLTSFKVGGLCYVEALPEVERALLAAGITPRIQAFAQDASSDIIAQRLKTLSQLCEAVIIVGPRFGHPYTMALGRMAAVLEVPVLFVEAGGVVARVGPTVLGHELPCLDCLNARHAANAGVVIDRRIDKLSTAVPTDLPPSPLVHPSLQSLALQSAAMEISRLALGESPQTFGGYLEIEWNGEIKRRTLLRVPLCNGCSPKNVERFPFHVTPITS